MTQVLGHRGAAGLFPENTLEGFVAAEALGVQAFELDAGITADGVVVVSHDPMLNPDITRDATGTWLTSRGPAIRSLTYAQLCIYDVGRIRPGSPASSRYPDRSPHDGARIPSLAAVLNALPEARFTIEVKVDPRHPEWTAPADVLTDAVLAVVDAAGATGRVVIQSFDWRVQHHIRSVRPDLTLAWLTSAETVRDAALWWDGVAAHGSVPAIVAAQGGPIWAPEHRDLTKTQIQEAHALGLRVTPWTVNRADDMSRLIDWRVDGLISDRPDRALDRNRLGSRCQPGLS